MSAAEEELLLDEIKNTLGHAGYRPDEAVTHVDAVPGLYAIHGSAQTWAALGLDHRPGPLYVGRALKSLVARDLNEHFAVKPGKSHPDGYTGGSTVRRSIAALLRPHLGFVGRPRRGKSSTATVRDCLNYELEGPMERPLTDWMQSHLTFSAWQAPPGEAPKRIGRLETRIISEWVPPVNLNGVPTALHTPALVRNRAAMQNEARDWAISRGAKL